MPQGTPGAKPVETVVHDLLQQLQVIEMAAASIERGDAGRHARAIAALRRAAADLERGLDELAAMARQPRG